MTLRIHNIMYDHSQEFRTYPAGVITVDTLTRAIHVHDGLTPNGWEQPTRTELGNYALKDLTNVTQESMNNALNTFGALNMNNADQVSTTQRDNAWTKLFGPAMLSNADIPDSNYLYVDKKDRKMKAGDLSTVIGFGMDFTKKKDRQAGVTYRADEDGFVTIQTWYSRDGHGSTGTGFYIDDVQIFDNEKTGWNDDNVRRCNFSVPAGTYPIASGQSYKYTNGGGISIYRYFWCPLKYKFKAEPTTEG